MAKRTDTLQRVSISKRSLHDFIRERLRIGLDRTALVSPWTSMCESQIDYSLQIIIWHGFDVMWKGASFTRPIRL